jgi:heme exporter protein D
MMQTEPVDGSARTEGALPEIAQKFDRAEKYAVLIWLLASAAVTAVLMLCGNRPLRALFGIWLAVTFCSVPLLCIALETVQRVLLRPVRQDDSLHETEAYSAEEGRRALRRFFTSRAVQ